MKVLSVYFLEILPLSRTASALDAVVWDLRVVVDVNYTRRARESYLVTASLILPPLSTTDGNASGGTVPCSVRFQTLCYPALLSRDGWYPSQRPFPLLALDLSLENKGRFEVDRLLRGDCTFCDRRSTRVTIHLRDNEGTLRHSIASIRRPVTEDYLHPRSV